VPTRTVIHWAPPSVISPPDRGPLRRDTAKRAGVAELRRALAGFERLRVPFEAAATRERLAEIVPAAQARPLLEAALATYALLGARPRHEAVRSRLQARGWLG
jgi:hypothetical protein